MPTKPAPPTPAPKELPIKFLLWNVHYGNRDYAGMVKVIEPNNADVVGLCEFTGNTQFMADAMSSFQKVFSVQPGTAGDIGYGTDIFYDRLKFEALEGGKVPVVCEGTRGGARAANWVVLRHRVTLHMFVTGGIHLSYCSANTCETVQECELGRLYDKFDELKLRYPGIPVLYMGDMNCCINGKLMVNVLEGKIGTRDVFLANDEARTQHNTYYNGGCAIDQIIAERRPDFTRVNGGWTGQGMNGQRLAGADHFPVFSDVLLGGD